MSDKVKVLVLCHGNINRSPFCAAILTKHPELEVQSAGLRPGLRPGKAAKKMRDAALECGVSLEDHRSQPVTVELYNWADVVIYMDGGNLKRLQVYHRVEGLGVHARWRNLSWYAGNGIKRIPDPNYIAKGTQEFHDVVKLIYDASQNLAKYLIEQR